MIEKVFNLKDSQTKLIERVIIDDNINYNHICLTTNDSLPEHFTNAPVYMTILAGTITIALNDNESQEYSKKTILVIPESTKMNISNKHDSLLEFTIIKAPAPIEI